ncbi:MAG: hypothetical protein EAY81_07790 [Bacteroidetes bacterium]|nr:MAG: hypothetical protein EAY81_07790 [Bacteroidota bacterium]
MLFLTSNFVLKLVCCNSAIGFKKAISIYLTNLSYFLNSILQPFYEDYLINSAFNVVNYNIKSHSNNCRGFLR